MGTGGDGQPVRAAGQLICLHPMGRHLTVLPAAGCRLIPQQGNDVGRDMRQPRLHPFDQFRIIRLGRHVHARIFFKPAARVRQDITCRGVADKGAPANMRLDIAAPRRFGISS